MPIDSNFEIIDIKNIDKFPQFATTNNLTLTLTRQNGLNDFIELVQPLTITYSTNIKKEEVQLNWNFYFMGIILMIIYLLQAGIVTLQESTS